MNPVDPFDELARRNPIPDPRVLPDPTDDEHASALLARVVGVRPPGADDRHRHRRRLILIPLAAAVAVATAAAAWVITRPASDPTSVACYRAVDLESDIFVAEPAAGGAIEACARAWSGGPFGSGDPPPLGACVLDSGVAAVFPATDGDPCGRLGLNRLEPFDGEEPPIIRVQDDLSERFGSRCIPVAEAEPHIRAVLAEAGLEAWTVVVPSAPPAERPCASVTIDVATRSVTVVPIPATPSG